jgi:hypothetical protein
VAYFFGEGQKVVASAASDIQDDFGSAELRVVSHQREPVFEQPLRVTVLFGKSRQGALIEERPDVSGFGYLRGRDAMQF